VVISEKDIPIAAKKELYLLNRVWYVLGNRSQVQGFGFTTNPPAIRRAGVNSEPVMDTTTFC